MARSIHRPLFLAIAVASTLALGGCAREIGAGTYDGRAVGDLAQTYSGTIQNVRAVEVEEGALLEQNRTGQLLGGVAGGFAGSAFGAGLGKAAAIAAGTIAGAVIGSLVEEEAKRQPALEYIVADDDGNLVTIVQGPEPQLGVGQRVFVQEGTTGRSRVIPAL